MKYSTVKIDYRDGKYNYYTVINKERYILKTWMDRCFDFQEGFGVVRKNGKENWARRDGTFLLDVWVDECFYFQEGFARIKKGNKENYIKPDGTFLIPNWADFCWNFHDGFGKYRIDGVWYKIDKFGNITKI